jgi:hypothetical protein
LVDTIQTPMPMTRIEIVDQDWDRGIDHPPRA